MKNFAKSILNYFAAFNETRFRFNSKLPYEWSNDPLTLDFSVFPAFEKRLLEGINQGTSFEFEVLKKEYTVTLTSNDFKKALLSHFETDLNKEFLETCLDQCRKRLAEAMPDQDPSELDRETKEFWNAASGSGAAPASGSEEPLARREGLLPRRESPLARRDCGIRN